MMYDVEKALNLEQSLHPKAQVQDLLKLLVQSCLGVAHLHIDEQNSLCMLAEERKNNSDMEIAIQDIGNGLCRVPLAYMKQEQLPLWNLLFLATWKHGKQDMEQFNVVLQRLQKDYDLSDEICSRAVEGVHHSELYRNAYQPCYRLIKQAYIQYFEAILYVWEQRQKNKHIRIGIDGRCASGKSTLASLLEEVFTVPMFHMDDYFLPVSLRGESRLAQIGGNIDYERFQKEVIQPLLKHDTVLYRRYDCQIDNFKEAIEIAYDTTSIWEGSYAHHPLFQSSLSGRIFVTCRSEIQKERLKKRSAALYNRFIEEWIPKEECYFETYGIKEQSDIVLDTSNF